MRGRYCVALLLVGAAAVSSAIPALGQPTRPDAIWARSTAGSHITLDGVLNEPAWALAESVIVRYGKENGIPGSGWKEEGGRLAKDSTRAVLKFLVDGNQLYLGATMADTSIGGAVDFNRFDGLLMAIKDHAAGVYPAPPAEYLYSWWYPDDTTLASTPGIDPCFRGTWGTIPCSTPRTPTQIANWNAATVVTGLSNSDAVLDKSYTVEMMFNLTPMGYDVTQAGGDIVEWNVSIYDCDWFWPINLSKFSVNRTWLQSPWGNASWYDEVHIYARPSVTINSGTLPAIQPDYRIQDAGAFPAPVVNGKLDDWAWQQVPGFDIRFDDPALRQSYSGVGQWRAGQFQPSVNGGLAAVVDPGDVTVKMLTKEDTLYIGLDVRDQVVQYVSSLDRWDGFIVTLTDLVKRYTDHNLYTWRASFQVGPSGALLKQDQLGYLMDTLLCARAGLELKPFTAVDTAGTSADQGYTAELAFDLTKLGYPHGLGDRGLFIGLDMLDGDSFTPFTDSYGTRTWWYRQYENECCPAFAYMDPGYLLVGVEGGPPPPTSFALRGAWPNPFHTTTRLRYTMPEWGEVTLEVFDVLGRQVARRALGLQSPGEHEAVLGREGLSTSVYLYRLRVANPINGALKASLAGKVMFLK